MKLTIKNKRKMILLKLLKKKSRLKPYNINLDICYEDNDILIINAKGYGCTSWCWKFRKYLG